MKEEYMTEKDALIEISNTLKNIEYALNAIGGVLEDRMSSGRRHD